MADYNGGLSCLPALASPGLTREELLLYCQAVLQPEGRQLAAGEVRGAWAAYLELEAEPVGWQAVLFPSADTAELLGTVPGREGALRVDVKDLLSDQLEAEVEFRRSDCEQPLVFEVPVDELWPTKHQELDWLNMDGTVKALDLIRTFYKHLWMPWDGDSDCPDWAGQHLANRVALHCSLAGGPGDQEAARRLDLLACRAEQNRTALLELEVEVGLESEEDIEEGGPGELSDQAVGRLLELHQEQDNIRREAELLENPRLRRAAVAVAQQRRAGRAEQGQELQVVWSGGSLADHLAAVSRLEVEFGASVRVVCCPDLQYALDRAQAGDTVVVISPGEYRLTGLGRLAGGGRLLGRAGAGRVLLQPGQPWSGLELAAGARLELSQLELHLGPRQAGLAVWAGGQLLLDGVRLVGGAAALQVGSAARLEATGCWLEGAGKGLEVWPAGEAELRDCRLEGGGVGAVLHKGGQLALTGCRVARHGQQGLVCHGAPAPATLDLQTGRAAALDCGAQLAVCCQFQDNASGDIRLVTGPAASPSLLRRSQLVRRASTPLVGGAGALSIPSTPIPHLNKVLTYQDTQPTP